MLRTIFLLPFLAAIVICALAVPYVGVLGWTCVALMAPHQLVWGGLGTARINMVLAITTVIGWALSREPKRLPFNLAGGLWLCFMAYMTFTTLVALAPDLAWEGWDRAIKIMALGLLVASMATNQVRIHALIWVIVLSLGYVGVRGGIFTLITGGRFHVVAEGAISFADNNILALALCAGVPLMNYLRMQSEWRSVRWGMAGAMGLVVVAILGTYSRGGLVGLTVTSGYFWWKSKQKIAIAVVGLAVLIPAVQFMPDNWVSRMSTIETADEDQSFEGRLQAWRFAMNVAESRPFTGAGFAATESSAVFNRYFTGPSGELAVPRAAHSIYFQVLGDHGFIGLALYLALLATTWRYTVKIRREARVEPRLAWAGDLASMLQVSLLSFMVTGAALSTAYHDMIFLLIGISIALRQLVRHAEPQKRTRAVSAQVGAVRPIGSVG